MIYKLNITQVLFLFRNTIFWILGFIIIVIYTNNHEEINNNFIVFITIAFTPFVLPFLILLLQYMFYSTYKIKISDNIIFFNKNKESINEIEIIEKHQSIKKNKQDNVAYLPWMAGTFYYYKIKLKTGKELLITCLMDSKQFPFENFINENNIQFESKGYFYPWIL